MISLPTEEQRQRAEWDLLLRDLELRGQRWETWRFVLQAMTAGAALFASGAALMALVIHLKVG